MRLNPWEVYGYILGLETAIKIAQKYKGINMENYIGELNEIIEMTKQIDGYDLFLEREKSNSA